MHLKRFYTAEPFLNRLLYIKTGYVLARGTRRLIILEDAGVPKQPYINILYIYNYIYLNINGCHIYL